ncbi:MAG: adenine deaminase [Synergistaceae bacterium]|nr:adenine deaminase [Synergistaceae bacterium]
MNDLLATARGDRPADLVIKGARVANVFTMEYEDADVAICGQRIVGVGAGHEAREVFDAKGGVLIPGMIDGHVHIESTMLAPPAFASAVSPHGTTTVMADPHEIANVMGMAGVEHMFHSSWGLPIDVFLGAPSCVPASRWESPRDELDMLDVEEMFRRGWCQHMGELMDFPAIIAGEPGVWGKIAAAGDVPLTGHAPGVGGKDLAAYMISGASSDHECSQLEEAREKLRRGMWIMMREGASFPDLRTLLPLVKEDRLAAARCMAVTDDITARYIAEVGHMDAKVRIMVTEGVDPLVALRMVTLSPAEHFRLWDRGAIAPGRRADMALVGSLESCDVAHVWKDGRLVVKSGRPTKSPRSGNASVSQAKAITPPTMDQLRVAAPADGAMMNVIGVLPGSGRTKALRVSPRVEDGQVVPDPERDIAKIVVMERHRGTGRLAVGFLNGMGIASGAIASSVAHDAHNFVAVGADDVSIMTALARLCETGGGLVATKGEGVKGFLPLPVAGLMTYLDAKSAARAIEDVEWQAEKLGVKMKSPFMGLSFLCLSVLPELRITDQGYVDITKGGALPLFS